MVLAVLTVFAGRLVYVQGIQGEAVAQEALQQRLGRDSSLAVRGQITDAKGDILARSVERYTLAVNQVELAEWSEPRSDPKVGGPSGAAAKLAPLLDMNAAELGALLTGESTWKVIKKGLLPEQMRDIKKLSIGGVQFERVLDRVYPNGSVAGNLLGWVNAEGDGAQGLEAVLDDKLAGSSGTYVWERGAGGQAIPGGYEDSTDAVEGDTVQLTILSDLQWKAEEAINAQVAATGADSGSVIVTDVTTGEILALADSGALDPNSPSGDLTGSRSISGVFDPGSTAKVITMAAALETGVVNPLTPFEVPYQYTTDNNQTFKDSHEHAGMRLTTTGVLAQSSNTGTVMIGEKIPQQVRYDYLAKFGFGQKTGVELPGESRGILHPVDEWDGRTKYAVLFGQGVSVTALQATQVFATIANGGVRVQPHLIKGWTAADGQYTPSTQAAPTQVVSKETADTVLTMLESAVDDGTGSAAAIPGYRVAGKTGTAQSFNPSGITASFIGVAPADQPRIAVSVVLHNPRTSEWGGTVAAPVFRDITRDALLELGVAPSGAPATLYATTW
ncbi:peptidoglycan D,D-transpeptidase FtsI family protein [Cellulomonas timonensis]|uniref:peptidoglycan D,D-transpeptidase FtsI family protein n=1 Tax=Cellulomonas timonensis TaxID=1689271 RepID=UPI00082CD876|nr:penicillin-binding protein 2 [Cellulomonas timonensis]